MSTGSGDSKPHNKRETQDIDVIPDIFNRLVIRSCDVLNNNNKSSSQEDLKDFDDSDDDYSVESFDPSSFGVIDDPGVLRFDSLDYPDFSDSDSDYSTEEILDTPTKTFLEETKVARVLRFSIENLFSSSLIKARKNLPRTKSLTDINELEASVRR